MLILHDPLTLTHRTFEFAYGHLQPALESPERISAILTTLTASPHTHKLQTLSCPIATTNTIPPDLSAILTATHDQGYMHHLATAHKAWVDAGAIEAHESILPECFPFPTRSGSAGDGTPKEPTDMYARAGYYAFDMSTGIMTSTFNAAIASAALALSGAQTLLSSSPPSHDTVLALCRPPGHHCDTRRAGGFCYINNAVVAATALQHSTPHSDSAEAKIAILDIDFHHGNGTQEHFYTSPSVLYVSIHGADEFPYYTGAPDETGVGPGLGTNLNLPIPTGSSVQVYLAALTTALDRMQEFDAEYLLVSLGFDTFALDPLGYFKIETGDYATIAGMIRGRSRGVKGALILLEGGYVIERLGANVLSFLGGWEGTEVGGGK